MYPGTHAATHPGKAAVVMGASGERVTYSELDERSARLARLLRERGARPGDTVALVAENHPRYLEVVWAALRSGLYLTAVNWHLAPNEAAYLVDDSNAKALVATARFAELATRVAELAPDCGIRLMMDGTADGFESYEAAIATQPEGPLADQPRGEVMLYSSGTTGRPKGIRRPLSGDAVDSPSRTGISTLARFLFGMTEDSVYLCPAPLYHAAGLQWSAGVHELGGTLVLLDRFDAEQMLAIIERERVTHVQVVPTMLVRLLKLPDETRRRYDLSSLRRLIHAAAPCPPDVKRRMIDWLGPIVDEYYSGTEGAGLTYIGAEDWLTHPGSVGRPLVGTPHICDETGQELPTGAAGMLYFERDEAPFEYHRDPEKTRESRHPSHPTWVTAGDMGYLDADGYLYLTDRKNFTIISGGVNIYPAEIEAALVMHPQVADVAVFGLPDAEMGEYVHAVVQLAEGVAGSPELAEQLRAYLRDGVAGYKVPRVVVFRDELPRMPTGKLAKGKLREEYLAQISA
ncbi:acyl-CoA synthetase [Frankia sp. CNm7]|uniref:Acyl-CoA synthetase n=1 Tax=Frankia nepalensis TaxID=1836974 RepID=A0A937R4S4_9ACTN|nr:acyl-CoA synthetase [Frankia nepalensis]MBL7495005.1 acyl-CoA synthetase [Frankia nepalensis]MBL7514684.1 acyl-CoA synthetase [Frankia nepalensis]MBL7519262.1 acyl-CoA synthetase [Frankia nepalensis]MBL7625758.1 acyl-CoA synthetase [Frankia nepalensis]